MLCLNRMVCQLATPQSATPQAKVWHSNVFPLGYDGSLMGGLNGMVSYQNYFGM